MIRASGGESFSLLLENSKMMEDSGIINEKKEDFIPLTIESIFDEFILARLPRELYYKRNPFVGVRGKILDFNCLVDGVIPLYEKGIVLLDEEILLEDISLYLFNNKKIGRLWNRRGHIGLIKFDSMKFYLNNKRVREISLFLANFEPFIKIIPYKMKEHNYAINSTQYLTLHF